MPLSAPVEREKRHMRDIQLEGFRRKDGLFDIEGTLTDRKTFDFPNRAKARPAGTFMHEMRVRVTIDAEYKIHDIEVASDTRPYDGTCDAVTPDYRQLIGLNLAKGFRKAVTEKFGRARGCTHINELLGALPTAAFQSFAGTLRTADDETQIASIMDGCYAMNRHSESVKRYFPTWYAGPAASKADNP